MRASLPTALALSAVAGLAGATALEARPRAKGKVIRVERPRHGANDAMLVCVVTEARGVAACFGRRPRPGEHGVALLAGSGVAGNVRIDTVKASVRGGCSSTAAFDVSFGQLSGQPVDPGADSVMLVFGRNLDPTRAALIEDTYSIRSPSGRDDDTPWAAIDEDGDDHYDLLVSSHPCSTSGQGDGAWCVDYWERRHGAVERLAQYVVNECP